VREAASVHVRSFAHCLSPGAAGHEEREFRSRGSSCDRARASRAAMYIVEAAMTVSLADGNERSFW